MISVNGHELKPTIFPDKTSQLWKLPQEALREPVRIDWRFEEEREILDLFALRQLLPKAMLDLYMPYLPYARQDKEPSNEATFNLYTFAHLINRLQAHQVTVFDAHNPRLCRRLIPGFENIWALNFHRTVLDSSRPDVIVFPDQGARDRYAENFANWPDILIMDKMRDQATGEILGVRVACEVGRTKDRGKYLIVDDICDGGATFLAVGDVIRARNERATAQVDLCVSHGIFSRSRERLRIGGIYQIFTTDSLIKNREEIGVYKV
jgi:ribose-phosphate pyrophosphokinase